MRAASSSAVLAAVRSVTILPSRISIRRGVCRGDLCVVGDEDDRAALLAQLAEQLEDVRAGFRVEVAGRFVGKDDLRIVDQRARDRHALHLAAAELERRVLHAVRKPDALDGRQRACRGARLPETPA